jgi:broad-specificity NMP kinase
VFAVIVTGAPGAGKTTCLIALADELIDRQIAHAAVDVDEVAWAYPYPSDQERLALLGHAWDAHRRAGHDVLLVAEVVESNAHLAELLGAVGADDYLLVRLEAKPVTMRERIIAREPPGWSGLEYLLGEVERYAVALPKLDGVHLTLDSERVKPEEEAALIRSERPDKLGG